MIVNPQTQNLIILFNTWCILRHGNMNACGYSFLYDEIKLFNATALVNKMVILTI